MIGRTAAMEKLFYAAIVLFVLCCKTSTGYPTSDNKDNCSKIDQMPCVKDNMTIHIDKKRVEMCCKSENCEACLEKDSAVIKRFDDPQCNFPSWVTIGPCDSRIFLKIHNIKENKWTVVCYQRDDNSVLSTTEVCKRHHWFVLVPVTASMILIFSAVLVSHQKKENSG